MGMGMMLKLAAASGSVFVLIHLVYRMLDKFWFRPKKLEKILRDQGLKGNPYRLFLGDQYESGKMIREAMSKPIGINDDAKKRVIPHVLKAIEKHGENSFMWVGPIPRVHITDPELIREVLTKYYTFQKNLHELDPITYFLLTGVGMLEGEPWAKRRRIIKSAFYFDKLKHMLPAFHFSCHNLMTKWENIVPKGGSSEVEIWHDARSLTGDVISRTLFGSNFEEGKKIFELINELTNLTIQVMQDVYIPGRWLLPTKRNNRMRAINKELQTRLTYIINKKMKAMNAGESSKEDFLGVLLKCSQDEIQENGNDQSAGLSIDDIICECKLFYFAGQDTTSTLITWTMVLLSRNPDWQTKAREEVFQVFGDKKPDYNEIKRLQVITMILYEVLRLYTPIVELTKVATEDIKLGELYLPAGVQVMMPQILLHHDTRVWGDDAMEFNPERFSEGVMNATKSQGEYFPFSLGPRMCIGQNFALLEAKMAMAMILQRFSFELSPSYVHAPYMLISMQPQHGAHLILHRI